jgi:amidase
MFELHHLSAREQWQWLHRGEISAVELTRHYFERIERLDPGLGAFITVTADAALAKAEALDAAGPGTAALWGIPFAEKDLYQRAGVRTTFGSRLFEHNIAAESDELVTVLDDAGGVSLGKTNAPEFGLPCYTESLVAPPARNPYNLTLGTGGSSGGAAVAVAAGLLPLAPGSDGGGSVRIPAAATGLVGLKPSRGRVPSGPGFDSLAGLVVPGPIARTVGDAAMLLDAMIAGGTFDFATGAPSWDGGALSNAAERGEGRFEIAVMTTSAWDSAYSIELEPDAFAAVAVAVEALGALGHGVDELALLPDDSFAGAFRTIWQVGASRIPAHGKELDLLEPLTRWLVERGREVSGEQLAQALEALTKYERSVIRQFAPFDAVLTPALAQTPRPFGWFDPVDAERNFAQQCQYTPFTAIANVAGLPAISLPVFQTDLGLSMGVQLIGRPGGENILLSIGAQLERRFSWQKRHPPQW